MMVLPVSATAQAEVDAWQPDKTKKLINYTTANLMNFGLGVQLEGIRDYGTGLALMWRGGSERQLLNITAGFEFIWHNPVDITPRHHDIRYAQISPNAAVRLNFVRWTKGSIYADGGISYNWNVESKYRSFDKEISDTLTRHHFSINPRIGFQTYNFDIGLYARYDLKPTFLQQKIYEDSSYDYYALGPVINERWSLGISLILYLRGY